MLAQVEKNIQDIKHGKRQHHHWHFIYKKRRRHALGISTKQMAISQVFSLAGSIIAGVLLDANKESIALMAGAFVMLPGAFDFDGSVGAALSAKVNHRLEDDSVETLTVFSSSVWYAFRLALLGGLMVGAIGAAIAVLFFEAEFWRVFTLGWLSIVLSALVGFPLIAGMSILFRKRGINPDDVVGPIESSIFDILTVVSFALIVGWLL